jgi:N-acetylglucosaminyl-diphospho-decaprenol L-rhamnosyltransferase
MTLENDLSGVDPRPSSTTLDLSVVVVSWNTIDLLRNCLTTVSAHVAGVNAEIIVVDNASSDGSATMVEREFPRIRLIRNTHNVGFACANNLAIRISLGRYVLLLNSDTVVAGGAVPALTKFMDDHPEAGACGPRLIRPDGLPQAYSFGGDPAPSYLARRAIFRFLFRRDLHKWDSDEVRRVDWVSGACLLARRATIDQVGLLDEAMFMYFEDNDWCRRMRQAGWQIYHCPFVSVVHVGGQSLVNNPSARAAYYQSLQRFYQKHYSPLAGIALRLGIPAYRLIYGGRYVSRP